ncbi:Beta-galactosidase protein [Spatholobus suberectus]|nr:Beta-galactosidase protein [Spatholobus suberectus]
MEALHCGYTILPEIELRTDNPIYENEMQNFITKIVNMVKEANLLASQGGPVIVAQIENDYGDITWGYGDARMTYIKWYIPGLVTGNVLGKPFKQGKRVQSSFQFSKAESLAASLQKRCRLLTITTRTQD